MTATYTDPFDKVESTRPSLCYPTAEVYDSREVDEAAEAMRQRIEALEQQMLLLESDLRDVRQQRDDAIAEAGRWHSDYVRERDTLRDVMREHARV